MREVLDALEWVRVQMMHTGSPDFIRQRQAEARVQALCAKLVRGEGERERGSAEQPNRHP